MSMGLLATFLTSCSTQDSTPLAQAAQQSWPWWGGGRWARHEGMRTGELFLTLSCAVWER